MKNELTRHILENYANIKSSEIRPVGADLFHADRRTDRHDEANSRFRNFANAPNKMSLCLTDLRHCCDGLTDRQTDRQTQ
jgi:hypothetical protein